MSLDLLGLALADAHRALDLPQRRDIAGPGSGKRPPGRVQQAAGRGVAAAGQLIGCVRCCIRRYGPRGWVHPGVAPLPDLQWVIGAYALTLAALLLTAGALADRFGRRITFSAG
ncbi:MAG: hypothetical protein ACRDPY_26285 [Streptosporangiaceae bacterium]